MTLSRSESLQRIERQIEAERDDLCPDAAVLTGYVILTEWAAADGEVYLTESRPDDQPYWRTLGLLAAARMSIDHSVQQRAAEEDEGE